jgi:hypothetical protein
MDIIGEQKMITLPLKSMTLNEKFLAIEMIWEDICHTSAAFPSPAWHEAVLKERDERIAKGQDKLIDWEVAKKQLRKSL